MPRWLGWGLVAAGLLEAPWLAVLASTLPARATAAHWPAAWTGLDAMEAAGLLATGVLLLRRDSRCGLAAVATGMLLLADAWFDVTTAANGHAQATALVMAVFPELPLCALLAVLAVRTDRHARRHQPAGTSPPAPARHGGPAGRLAAVRVLVIGSGGREHALARALARDAGVTEIHAAPGNPGIAALAEVHQVVPTDPGAVTALAEKTGADLVVIGPEAPLVAGVADAVREAGVTCFGPGAGAAMIEGSKSFAKQVMAEAGIPTAAARTCVSEADAVAALDAFGPPYVVKADGLAAGKGVVVTQDRREATRHARDCGTVVIEEFLDGPEVSVFALADGASATALIPAQDYKRAHDGDAGPNTGGMGAYAPLPWAPPGLAEETMARVIEPALAQLRARGTPYTGLLYAGLCLTSDGIKVVEFNARFGDPETQVVLDRLETPLGGLLRAAAAGGLAGTGPLRWAPGCAVTVVIAAEGYPGRPVRGDQIDGLDQAERCNDGYILHAGTRAAREGRLESGGGRVLNVVGTGASLGAARAAAYRAAAKVRMRGGWYRRDIAFRAEAGPPAGTGQPAGE